jgi:hypothetical protein
MMHGAGYYRHDRGPWRCRGNANQNLAQD